VEWLNYSDRTEVRVVPLPRSLANLKQEISEKKWAEARQWAGGRTSKTKYRMPESQRPDGTVAGLDHELKDRTCLTLVSPKVNPKRFVGVFSQCSSNSLVSRVALPLASA